MAAPAELPPLSIRGVPLFDAPERGVRVEPAAHGVFLSFTCDKPCARFAVSLGGLLGLHRLVALFRYEPFWMKPRTGTRVEDVPPDTQFLLAELANGDIAIVVPLVSEPFRVGLQGSGSQLVAVADSGDPSTCGTEALLAYAAVGKDPFELVRSGVKEVAERLGSFELTSQQSPPAFLNDFGWCTWDAFYQDVSHAELVRGLESFRAGGVAPRFLILDDGWQSVRQAPTGEKRLAGFAANEKFPGGLRRSVELAKLTFGVRTFLVWHAVQGYWGGIDAGALPAYGVATTERRQSPEILSHWPAANTDHWGANVGRPAPDSLASFYDDYHLALAAEGVDGVKVDNQASIEALAHGAGGRVHWAGATREGLEASIERHFGGRLLACMSCANDLFYRTRRFGLFRSSTDFWPNRPESHGLHAHTNALVSLWFGEIGQPDWDMFQSAHPAGRFHAALRAVSGGPVYVSDPPESHDFSLLRKLVLSDGSVLRALCPGLPTRDCLFVDPVVDPVLFKIWTENRHSALIGVFNARYRTDGNRLEGSVAASDVPSLAGDDFAVYFQERRELARASRSTRFPLVLDTLESELLTFVPVERGVAAIGLVDKLNSGAAISRRGWRETNFELELRDGGELLIFSERQPRAVRVDGAPVATFEYRKPRLSVRVATGAPRLVELEYSGLDA
jgi:raffinose synthase